MVQEMLLHAPTGNVVLSLPPAFDNVLPGIPWGQFDALFTPAYWKGQVHQHERLGTYEPTPLGTSVDEELAACLLGGYGIPAELGMAAFERVRDLNLIFPGVSAAVIETALADPFEIAGRLRRYRFHRQKANALSRALELLPKIDFSVGDKSLREGLTTLPGIGRKTASWIVRNFRCSDEVAIVDVHIARAGRIAGFISPFWEPSRHYLVMEEKFIAFAKALDVRASVLDGLMWDHMRRLGQLAREDDSGLTLAALHRVRGTPIAATPHATARASAGSSIRMNSTPKSPSGQNPRPKAPEARCNVAKSVPPSRQSKLPGFS
jgi:hypothetical protein